MLSQYILKYFIFYNFKNSTTDKNCCTTQPIANKFYDVGEKFLFKSKTKDSAA